NRPVAYVNSITGIPSSMRIGSQFTLADAKISPADANYKDIVWSIPENGIGSINNGILTANSEGLISLSALINQGSHPAYSQDFSILTYDIMPNSLPTPVANPAEGIYKDQQNVELTTEAQDATIYYTLDGSTPKAPVERGIVSGSTMKYTEPISLTASARLRAITANDSGLSSGIAEELYTITSADISDITVTTGANGKITPNGGNAGIVNVVNNTKQTFYIVANEGYLIDDVKVDGTSVGVVASYTFENVKEAHSISATFKERKVTHVIDAKTGANGSITPSGTVIVTDNLDQPFTITADEGYLISDVKVDGESVGPVASYIFKNVKKAHSISAIFEDSHT
ncbi:MAG: chitobiase/beta-hexosaminidase C-terminal domain-containing protein, partial [Clostridiales bacterium]